jgi:tRNA(Arg) A34 adenosine deaminase TadA
MTSRSTLVQNQTKGEMLHMSSFMDLALEEAKQAKARGEVPVGAVLVCGGKVVARAGNRTREMNDPTAHAEILVIREGAGQLGKERLNDCDLFVTLEPCTMCAGAISFARIKRLYFGAEDVKGGAVENGLRFFSSPSCHHTPEVYSGIGEQKSSEILREFFKAKR